MSEYAAFDWEIASEHHNKEHLALLREYQNKPISFNDYLDLYREVPKCGSRTHMNSRGAKEYAHLKSKFGFFGGVE